MLSVLLQLYGGLAEVWPLWTDPDNCVSRFCDDVKFTELLPSTLMRVSADFGQPPHTSFPQ